LVLVPFPDVGYVNAYASDISVRLAAETALKESGERLRDIASAASDWFWETDENMRFIFLSDRAYDLLDIEKDSVLGKMSLDESGTEKKREKSGKWRTYLLDIEAHRPFRDFSYSITDRDGNRRHLTISGVPIFEDDGTFCGYRGTGTDVTGLVAAEEALRASEERHRMFAADVAHELRTPLAIFRSNLDSLEDSDAGVSLRGEVDSMTRIVEQLLVSARMDTLEIGENDVADLKGICTKVATYIAPLAVMEYKSLEVLAPEGPVLIRGHEGALEQALRNLIENAIRYSARKTTITIEVSPEPSIRVIDHGRGVPLQKREVIFRRFLRSDRRSGGAGIGLSIVRRVVDAHRGVIRVKDTPGGGATFEIVFPPELLLEADPEREGGI
ncbi:MAG TPA: PAS domain-containing sensor histidine kinase, partial [Rhodospirillales bacterium]|nr:PAS domain-containing sensor histidine kinase [Rhodospirillales bacterium]